ncbi:hypothetical protein GCM10017559_08350 [Streptosporangium longisporum]|uniref:Uncharacterized protein n=1 Tax=Streptosporangium longisporum TaxID=46187 RepID=A0ABN3XTY4_9ACTN
MSEWKAGRGTTRTSGGEAVLEWGGTEMRMGPDEAEEVAAALILAAIAARREREES